MAAALSHVSWSKASLQFGEWPCSFSKRAWGLREAKWVPKWEPLPCLSIVWTCMCNHCNHHPRTPCQDLCCIRNDETEWNWWDILNHIETIRDVNRHCERGQNHQGLVEICRFVWDSVRHGLKRWTSWNAISRMLALPRAMAHQHPSASASNQSNQSTQQNGINYDSFKLIWNKHKQHTLEMFGDFVIPWPLMSVYNWGNGLRGRLDGQSSAGARWVGHQMASATHSTSRILMDFGQFFG